MAPTKASDLVPEKWCLDPETSVREFGTVQEMDDRFIASDDVARQRAEPSDGDMELNGGIKSWEDAQCTLM
jgi:hypothetical protein